MCMPERFFFNRKYQVSLKGSFHSFLILSKTKQKIQPALYWTYFKTGPGIFPLFVVFFVCLFVCFFGEAMGSQSTMARVKPSG